MFRNFSHEFISLVALLLLTVLMANPVFAHIQGQSYIFLNVDEKAVTGRVEITVKDLNKVLSLDLPEDRSVTLEQIHANSALIDDYVLKHVDISINGKAGRFSIVGYEKLNVSFAQFVLINFKMMPSGDPPVLFDIDNSLIFDNDQNHLSLLVVENNWTTGTFDNESVVSLTFTESKRKQRLDLSNGSVLQGLWGFIQLGMHHIWIGADHVLFLLALFLPSVMQRAGNRWVGVTELRSALFRILKIVTVFTIAHSITLSLASLGVINLESRLVESIIAISIGVAALHIIYPKVSSHALWVVLMFGMFHGFGFASVLSEMQIPERYLVWSLLGFNLGVEMGQAAIALVVVPILYSVRHLFVYARIVMPLGAAGLIAISVYWFIERAFGFDFRVGSSLKALIGL